MTLYLFDELLIDVDAIIGAVGIGNKEVDTELLCRGWEKVITLRRSTKTAFDSWAQSIEPFLLKASKSDLD